MKSKTHIQKVIRSYFSIFCCLSFFLKDRSIFSCIGLEFVPQETVMCNGAPKTSKYLSCRGYWTALMLQMYISVMKTSYYISEKQCAIFC